MIHQSPGEFLSILGPLQSSLYNADELCVALGCPTLPHTKMLCHGHVAHLPRASKTPFFSLNKAYLFSKTQHKVGRYSFLSSLETLSRNLISALISLCCNWRTADLPTALQAPWEQRWVCSSILCALRSLSLAIISARVPTMDHPTSLE